MMKHAFVSGLLMLIFLTGYSREGMSGSIANADTKPAYIQGIIKGGPLSGQSLNVTFWENYIRGASNLGGRSFTTPVSKDGHFRITIRSLKQMGRIRLANYQHGLEIFAFQLIEPGDSVFLTIDLRDNKKEFSFSNRGSAKYQAYHSAHAGRNIYWDKNDPVSTFMRIDSAVSRKSAIIDGYKERMSEEAHFITRADVTGEQYANMFLNIRGTDSVRRDAWKDVMQSFFKTIDTSRSEWLVQSKGYIDFLYEKVKTDMCFLRQWRPFSFKELYDKLSAEFSGVLREKLLTYALVHSTDLKVFFQGSDADEFTACLNDAFELIDTKYLKETVKKTLLTMGKGADAYDFCLNGLDGKKVNLHDFRGKVVFIDVWGAYCTGCAQFRDAFEKEVFPFIKDNKNVVVVSITMDKERAVWEEGLKTYSHSDFINLSFGKKGEDHPMCRHYDINSIPHLLLIDGKGKIFSSTLPYTGSGKELLELIRKALVYNQTPME